MSSSNNFSNNTNNNQSSSNRIVTTGSRLIKIKLASGISLQRMSFKDNFYNLLENIPGFIKLSLKLILCREIPLASLILIKRDKVVTIRLLVAAAEGRLELLLLLLLL
jgi:hypothetical protein